MALHVRKFQSPKELEEHRKQQYKFSTPPWKEVYRKKCVENLRRNRQKFLDRFRNASEGKEQYSSLVEDVMTEEWNMMRKENSLLPSCTELMFASHDEEIAYMNSIMDEIQSSLKNEEEHFIEMHYKDYEESLCAAVDSMNSNGLICPLCQKNVLHMNKHMIYCECGLRLNTEQDALTLNDMKYSLDMARLEHDNNCTDTAVYSVVNTAGIDNLLMTCSSCDFMFIII